MTNDTRKLLAFALALGSVMFAEKAVIRAEEATPVEVTPIVETISTETADNNIVNTNDTNTEQLSSGEANTNPHPGYDKSLEPTEVNVTTDPSKDSEKIITVDTTFTDKEGNTLKVICDSLTEGNKESFLEVLSQYYTEENAVPIKLINEDFVDTDKYSISTNGYDQLHCWAIAAANVLWTTGWAVDVVNPLTNQSFASSDEIATYFATYLTDNFGFADNAYEWFFNGNYLSWASEYNSLYTGQPSNYAQLTDSKNKYINDDNGSGITQSGLIKDYSVYPLKSNVVLSTSANLANIANLDYLGSEFAAELTIQQIYNGQATGHAITIAGVIKDPNETDPLKAYKALIIADSDNDCSSQETLPSNDDSALQIKKNLTKSYTIYKLGLYTGEDGITYWDLLNYAPDTEFHAILNSMDTLSMKTPSSLALAEEKDEKATKNTSETADLVLCYQFTTLNNQITNTFNVGDHIFYNFVDDNPSKKDYQGITYHKIDIYKNGKLVCSIPYSEDLTVKSAANAEFSGETLGAISVDLTNYMDFGPGSYAVNATLNVGSETSDRIPEAYYKNNTLTQSGYAYFIVVGEEEEEKVEPKQETSQAIPAPIPTGSKEAVNTSVFTSIQSFVSLIVVSLGGIITGLKRRK